MNCVCPIAPAHEPTISARSNVALFEDDQGGQQFVTEVVAAKADIGEARQRANDIVRSEHNRRNRSPGPRRPESRPHRRRRSSLALASQALAAVRLGAAALDSIGRNGAGDVVPDRTHKLRLRFRHCDDLRVEGDARKGGVESPARNAALLGRAARARRRIRGTGRDGNGPVASRAAFADTARPVKPSATSADAQERQNDKACARRPDRLRIASVNS